MAVAEARAVWQRAANRFFVQEDGKRVPKLACCQSSSSTSKQVDVEPASEADGQDQPPVGFVPHNRNPAYSNMPPDTRWWLHLQPGYGYQKCLKYLETDVEVPRDSRSSGDSTNIESRDSGELIKSMNIEETYELIEMDPFGCSISKQSDDFSVVPDGEKTLPWWRTTVADELPQKIPFGKQLNTPLGCFDTDAIVSSSDRNDQTCSVNAQSHRDSTEGLSRSSSKKSFSYRMTHKTREASESESSKAKLLEALCHSQTRAREAEKAAKQAYAEKEHIVKLFFRQASQLFAYKQWFHLLQLENLYFQIKYNDQPEKVRKAPLPQRSAKGKQHKRVRPRNGVKNYIVGIALGLSLVGAGLLLGWTVGWLLPL